MGHIPPPPPVSRIEAERRKERRKIGTKHAGIEPESAHPMQAIGLIIGVLALIGYLIYSYIIPFFR